MIRNALLLIPLILAVGLTGCSDDLARPEKLPAYNPGFRSLDTRDNLLFNLELAYKQRNFEEFRKLLDATPGVFIFYFGQDDIDQGVAAGPAWDVATELAVTRGLMDRTPPPGEARADDIILELKYTEDEEDWSATVPETHPDETWYFKDVTYRLEVRIGLTTHTQNKDVQARFTVREVEEGSNKIWQIVRWHDDVPAPPDTLQLARGHRTAETGESTWGVIKQVFRKGI